MSMPIDIERLDEIVRTAARDELLPRFAKVTREHKIDGSFLTEADLAVQARVARQLKLLSPDILFLGEEMSAEQQDTLLSSGQTLWCLDPLDGTSNFAAGIPCFSVSLALVEHGEVVFGLVYDPNRDELFSAKKGQGAFLNGEPLLVIQSGLDLKHATALIDYKRLAPDLATRLVREIPYASQRSFGSVALDWCWMAASRCHVYLHGRSNIWDYAAGNLIFSEAGGHSCTLDGEPIFVNALTPRSSVGAVDESLFKAWTSWLQN